LWSSFRSCRSSGRERSRDHRGLAWYAGAFDDGSRMGDELVPRAAEVDLDAGVAQPGGGIGQHG
jgi:hypothetical protein